jgi:hypothetical protein
MKLIVAFSALLLATAAHAVPFADCDVANVVPVKNDAGEILYWQNTNGGGKADRGSFGADVAAALAARK